MTRKERREKFSWFLFMLGYFTAGYLAINWISSQRSFYIDLATPIDRAIPFVPIFIFGYILVYLSIVLAYFTIDDMRDWRSTVVSFLLATSLAYVIFLSFPVRMDLRPEITFLPGTVASITRFYYFIDLPYNCFPSLHVTYPAIATIMLWQTHKRMRWVMLAMTITVAVSVVLVKQHYIADVLAGFLNGWSSSWVGRKIDARGAKKMMAEPSEDSLR